MDGLNAGMVVIKEVSILPNQFPILMPCCLEVHISNFRHI